MPNEAERWIVIPRWDGEDGFQHYKDREPIWIKNYTRLLANWQYLGLSFRLRGLLHGIWLLYAASGRELGASPAQLGRMLGDDTVRARDLKALSDAGFIVLSASKPLAPRYHSRVSREKEREADREGGSSSVSETQGLTEARPETRANGQPPAGTTERPGEIERIGNLIEQSLAQAKGEPTA